SGIPCAIKVFRQLDESAGASHKDTRSFYLRELEVLCSTSHPNIIRLLDFGYTLDTGEDALVLEWVDGLDFQSASQHASRSHFCEMLFQVCAALDHIHSRGFIHGDLNPSNLIVTVPAEAPTTPPCVKMFDFEYATTPGSPTLPAFVGTPLYAAPET